MEKPKTKTEEPRIEYVRLQDIKPALRNPKLHDMAAIAASITRYGFVAPPIENAATGRIVAGHGRKEAVEAIKERGDAPPKRVKVAKNGDWLIPVIRGVAFDDEAKAEEYLLGDNRLAELGGWDNEELAPILAQINEGAEEALEAIGWTATSIQRILADLDPDPVRGQTPEEKQDGYNAGVIKQVVLYFKGDEFLSVINRIQSVMAIEGTENHTEMFLKLLAFYEKNNSSAKQG